MDEAASTLFLFSVCKSARGGKKKNPRPGISTKRVKQRSQRQRWLSDGDGDERWMNGDEIGSLVARRSPITAPVKEAESKVEGQVKRKRREKTE